MGERGEAPVDSVRGVSGRRGGRGSTAPQREAGGTVWTGCGKYLWLEWGENDIDGLVPVVVPVVGVADPLSATTSPGAAEGEKVVGALRVAERRLGWRCRTGGGA
jgi:hypothetical protein